MNSKCKKVWLALSVLAALAAFATVWVASLGGGPPQIITLSDGGKYRFAGVTWGTNHIQPSLLSHIVEHLPTKWAAYARAKLDPRTVLTQTLVTPAPWLVVWLKPLATNMPALKSRQNLQIVSWRIVDENGVAGGRVAAALVPSGLPWPVIVATVVPRRSRTLQFEFEPLAGNSTNTIRFRIQNPAFGHFPQWLAEPIPAVNAAGDLRIELDQFTAPAFQSPVYRPFKTEFAVSFMPAAGTNESWQVTEASLCDATSNVLESSTLTHEADGSYSLPGMLWPDESALRLRLGLKRTAGFPATDLITFSNLPIIQSPAFRLTPNGPRGAASMSGTVNGITVTLRNYSTRPSWNGPALGPYWVALDDAKNPGDLAVDIVSVTTDSGESLNASGADRQAGYWIFQSMPANAGTLTVTVAVQKKRYVEFLAKPVISP